MIFRDKLRVFVKKTFFYWDFPKIILVLALCFYFIFGSYRLTKFFTTDEHYWIHERILQYWQGIKRLDWKMTLINDKPGITLAYISGLGLFAEPHPDLFIEKTEKHITQYDVANTERLNLIFRLPILIFNGLFSIFLFWIIKKNVDDAWTALLAAILILLSPVLLGISRIVNPDSLLWAFSTASILSFTAYLRFREKKYAALTLIFLAASILTKYVAVVLFPFLFIALLYHYFLNFESWERRKEIKIEMKKLVAAYFILIAGALAMFGLLMPAAIFGRLFYEEKTIIEIIAQLKIMFEIIAAVVFFAFADIYFLSAQLAKSVFAFLRRTEKIWKRLLYLILSGNFLFVLVNWMGNQLFMNFDLIPFDARRDDLFIALPLYKKFILEFYPVVFSLSPLVIIFLLYIWIRSLFKEARNGYIVFLLSLFVIIYYAAVIKNDLLATVRYSISVYPVLFILAAVGIRELWDDLKLKEHWKNWLAAGLVILSASSLWITAPFYFDYTSFLLPKKYLVTGSWGEGGYEAAQYLNSLPDAENLTVWADYSGVCEFFVGKCIKIYVFEEKHYDIDYYVLTRRGEIRYRPSRSKWRKPQFVDAYKYYGREDPDWSLYIGGRPGNFIKIFKSEN